MKPNEVYLFSNCDYDVKTITDNIVSSKVMELIRQGDRVIIKPNFVQESHDKNDDWDYVITHPAVITAVLNLVLQKLNGKGEIILCDAPMNPANFEKIIEHMPIKDWEKMCLENKINFSIIDLRDREYRLAENGIVLEEIELPGDPKGKVLCNLAGSSEFHGKTVRKNGLYGADYNIKETNDAHNGQDNFYSVSQTVIEGDIFINIAKMKTHRKAGVTCCLKNLVGINTNKNLLPHHTSGTPKDGGDQFADSSNDRKLESKVTVLAKNIVYHIKFLAPLLVPLKQMAIKKWGSNKETVRSGAWYGNDTLWRTILDLNKVLFYSNADGSLGEDRPESRKRYIGIVDGIYAGEGNGPLSPDKIVAGNLLCGINPVAIDAVAVKIMGLDIEKVKSVSMGFCCKAYKLADFSYEDVMCNIGNKKYCITDIPTELIHKFKPADGWLGHLEAENI